ncbi:MAG: heavy-metal-associated domain-containing protein [Deltaproteobacteria bacterium]|nr:heavy-metal-associated domain-containing protein [Deltaproteobacteria bacterium]MDQ3295664.1 cation transporter [Myxococcota bacterium]
MSNEQDTILEVQGMTCPSCIRHVSSALTDLDGVVKVDVKLRDGIVIVKHDTTRAPVTQLIETLNEAGYASKQQSL